MIQGIISVTKEEIVFVTQCEQCGHEISGPTEKRVKYLLESHRFWIHERGLAQ